MTTNDTQDAQSAAWKKRLAKSIIGALFLAGGVCFVLGAIEDWKAAAITVAVFGGFVAVMWAAITLGDTHER
jgi:hypothetical protein